MRDLSLHILDLIENSATAGASVVLVAVAADTATDMLTVGVEDNGPGLDLPIEQAADPFFTTKSGKRTGLGLSLFQAAAQRADGEMTLERSDLGGLAVRARMKLSHVDRSPLGDLAATIASVAMGNPQVDLHLEVRLDQRHLSLKTYEVAASLDPDRRQPWDVARKVSELINARLGPMTV